MGSDTHSALRTPRSALRVVVERETGIEPATNSLEGCDSTTELLPPVFSRRWFAWPRWPFLAPLLPLGVSRVWAAAGHTELAKGFEPPTL